MNWFSLWGLAVMLLSGLLLGWLIEMFIDWRFWRNRHTAQQAEAKQLQGALNRALSAKSAVETELNSERKRVKASETHISSLEGDLEATVAERNKYQKELSNSSVRLRQMAAVEQANDTLRGKLNSAESRVRELDGERSTLSTKLTDVQTRFASTDSTVSTLQTTLSGHEQNLQSLQSERDTLREQLANTEAEVATLSAHLTNAKEDAEETERLRLQLDEANTEVESLRGNLATAVARVEDSSEIEGDYGDLSTRLEASENDLITEHNKLVAAEVKLQNLADKLTDERLRTQMLEKKMAETGGEGEPSTLQAELDGANAEIVELRAQLAKSQPVQAPTAVSKPIQKDKLQKIKGIGDVFARRLNDEGIYSFAQFASQTPEKIADIIQAKSWQAVDIDSLIAQATELADGGSV